MTSADDFHLISWRNFALLASIAFAVMIPVGLRYVISRKTGGTADGLVLPESPIIGAREQRGNGIDPDRLSLASDEFAGDAVPLEGGNGKKFFGLGSNANESAKTDGKTLFAIEGDDEIELETEPEVSGSGSGSDSDGDRLLAKGPPLRSLPK